MKILYHSRFLKQFKKLPKDLQLIFSKKESIFRSNPFIKSLETHKLHPPFVNTWAFSLNKKYRVAFDFVGEDMVLFHAIGTHDIYK